MNIYKTTAIACLLATPAFAHTLDEYVQATVISLEENRVHAQMRMIPGADVADGILAAIDTNRDGSISDTEQRAYANRVLHDVSLAIDQHHLTPHVVAVSFPDVALIKDGVGEILIDFEAELPPGGPTRRLTFENHHQRRIAAYMTNCSVPSDPRIRVVAQKRNESQSFYQLDIAESGGLAAR